MLPRFDETTGLAQLRVTKKRKIARLKLMRKAVVGSVFILVLDTVHRKVILVQNE